MKPAVAEYLHQKETVRGSLQDIDARIILAIDELQRAAGVSGDLLEIGVSYGQRAILLGYCVQASERLVVCDTFEDTKGFGSENRADHALPHQGLRRSEFEHNYRRFHLTLPDIIAGRSREIDRDRLAAHFRLIHVDGSHAYVDVRADILIARRLNRAWRCGDSRRLVAGPRSWCCPRDLGRIHARRLDPAVLNVIQDVRDVGRWRAHRFGRGRMGTAPTRL
jgi:Methyltransferase domain